jgi:hypothetical protein
MAESPIGSIMAYGGKKPDPAWESGNGWYLCDGRPVDPSDFPALFRAIGFAWGRDGNNFKLPNLQGYFLRGVDLSPDQPVDTERNARKARYPGGNAGAEVGSFQTWATALPPSPPPGSKEPDRSFKITTSGDHTHLLNFQLDAARDVNGTDNTVAYPGRPETDVPIRSAGAHSHGIYATNGDSETRPVNAYVHWIIRAA